MFDFSKLESYRENNRIEAKKSAGGLPKSLWETYSAFANSAGGIILLGVEERPDKTLNPVGVKQPENLIKDFWDTINNPQKVSVNILSDKCVTAQELKGKQIVVIKVPRAERGDKPVYIGSSPMTGSYRRNGEGDYKCKAEEVRAMLRDASPSPMDMRVLENMDLEAFDKDSLRRYRIRMKSYRPGHVWEELEDSDFLYRLGALGRGSDGNLHPTAAGLLMFGQEYEIVKEFPDYFLDYQERLDENRWTDRIVSSSGDWSGNVYDFYFRVYNKLTQSIKIPFKLENGIRVEDTSVHNALREAIANCLINADYSGKYGLVIVRTRQEIRLSNPGGFRIDLELAKNGGFSDPRNTTLMKMFNLIDIGERAGSGIPNIYAVWQKQGCADPQLSESFEPERTTLLLDISGFEIASSAEISAAKSAANSEIAADEISAEKSGKKSSAAKNGTVKASAKIGGNKSAETSAANSEIAADKVSAEKSGKNSSAAKNGTVKGSAKIGGNKSAETSAANSEIAADEVSAEKSGKNSSAAKNGTVKGSAKIGGNKSAETSAANSEIAADEVSAEKSGKKSSAAKNGTVKGSGKIGGNKSAETSAANSKISADEVSAEKSGKKSSAAKNGTVKASAKIGGNKSAGKSAANSEIAADEMSAEKSGKNSSAAKNGTVKGSGKIGGNKSAGKSAANSEISADKASAEIYKKMIIKYLQRHKTAKTSELAKAIRLQPSRTRDYLQQMTKDNIIVPEGLSRSRKYRLK